VKKWVPIAAVALGLALASSALASDAGYLYGRVTTDDGDVYEGELRWGNEEAFWDDIFNATKIGNDNIDYVDNATLDRLRRHRRNVFEVLFTDRDEDFTHVFAARFGDLKRIDVRGDHRLTVTFRNGEEMRLAGGSNDVGARITVLDPGVGKMRLRWNRIRSIEFMETPARLKDKLGDPLYGTVKTDRFAYTGTIQWDNDETMSVDRLDGDTRDGDVSIAFGDIQKIRKHRRGVLVTLKSGSEMYVTGSNDVNRENRGVVVKVPDIGSVKIGWKDFEEITFSDAPRSGPTYASFGQGRKLKGVVESRDGDRYAGDIVFDLDEAWDFELLQGVNGDTEYLIPFRQIARIEPKSPFRADVHLRSGLVIELEDGQDVTRENTGVLVFTSDRRKPEYLAWRDVGTIRFD